MSNALDLWPEATRDRGVLPGRVDPGLLPGPDIACSNRYITTAQNPAGASPAAQVDLVAS